MESRLYQAALRGNVEELRLLISENPLILTDYALIYPHENPLHVSTKAGHVGFVKEIIGLKPDLVMELNREGFRPLDIASSLGHVEIVKELLVTLGSEICSLKGREGRTAIHYAAINGNLEVMDALLSVDPECVKDKTTLKETSLHLAVKYHRFDAFRTLLEWLQQGDHGTLEEILNSHDNEGNTVLHLAVGRKQREVVQLVLANNSTANALNWKATNSRGQTAMDIMENIITDNPGDVHLKELVLHCTGAALAANASIVPPSSTPAAADQSQQLEEIINIIAPNNQQEPITQEGTTTITGNQKVDSVEKEAERAALLVFFALIMTVTLQAGINFPSHIMPSSSSSQQPKNGQSTRNASYNSNFNALLFLLLINSSLVSSIYSIIVLIGNLPWIRREFWFSLLSIWAAYAVSAFVALGSCVDDFRLFFAVVFVIPCCIPFLIRVVLPMLGKAIFICGSSIRTRRAG